MEAKRPGTTNWKKKRRGLNNQVAVNDEDESEALKKGKKQKDAREPALRLNVL